MIEGESILCFAPEKWQHIWRNRHQIMSRLAAHNKVLFVEPRPYFKSVWRDWRAGKIGWADLRAPLVTQVNVGATLCGCPQGKLWVYHSPVYAPISGRFPLSALFRWLRETQMKSVMRRLGFRAPILWLYRPNMADLLGRFGEKLVIYHIVDEYAAYEAEFAEVYGESRRASVERSERTLLQAADLVIVTSASLLERKRAYNANTHWVPNGVDYEAFASERDLEPPADVAALPKPIIGYVGAINEKLDYDLLRRVAETFPFGSLILVGPVDLRLDFAGLRKLEELPNVHLLGAKPVAEVACYMRACQVCLMPYKLNEWTAHINPLKLYEYLAAGKPVVSTAIPAVRGLDAGLVYVAAEHGRTTPASEAFCQYVRQALAEHDERLSVASVGANLVFAKRRQEFASHNTWDERVEKLSVLIASTLSGPRHVGGEY